MIFHTRMTYLKQGEIIDEDGYGFPVYGPDEEVTFYGELIPLTSTETSDGTSTSRVVTELRILTPAHVTVTAQDKIHAGGAVFQVQGDPLPILMGGRLQHSEVVVKRVTG